MELQNTVKADVAAWMVGHCHRDLSSFLTYQENKTSGTPTVTEEPAKTTTGDVADGNSPVKEEQQTKKNSTLLVISTNCDTYKQSTPWGGYTMEAGTDTEQAFEIVQIDTKRHKLYLTRVGAGVDRTFQY